VTYKLNNKADHDEHIYSLFRLYGKVLAKAIFERIPLNTYLDRTIIR